MVDFRRWIIALAALALLAGLASAQVVGGGTGPLTCSANVAVPPTLRAEGMTDLIGDIVITCTGGSALTTGSVIPTANFTVSLGTNVTSRIIGSNNVSEALLLIDEPGAPLAAIVSGFGPGAPQTPCLSTVGAGVGGCQEFANVVGGLPVATSTASGTTPGANVFFGQVFGNQVVFNGIPVLPPVSASTSRVFRITNIRANISGLGGGGQPGTTPLVASVSISGSSSVPVNNPLVNAGFIQAGLNATNTGVRNANNTSSGSGTTFNQCNSVTLGSVATLQFAENFATAFKTRVAPTSNYNGQAGSAAVNQNIPGAIFNNSESGLILTAAPTFGSAPSATPGLADYGTRLKAVFNNIPSGVTLYVSVTNLNANIPGGAVTAPASTSVTSFAQLVSGEAVSDGSGGTVPALTSTTTAGSIPVAALTAVNGSATAVWEVINANPNAMENFVFGVWASFTANTASNLPTPTTAPGGTVNLSYAPTPPVPFSATAGAAASSSLTIPRFADTSSAKSIIGINICQTLLLFPYVTNQAGFDTGIAIANTTTDPIGTSAQAGACNLTWYDGTGKTAAFNTGNIATGTVYANLVSVMASGFQGYMFAQCNFQLAHGFAFISDLGARQLAMGYLALVVSNGGVVRGNAPAAESLAQ